MFPIRDVNPTRITPYVTLTIIAINLIVYFGFQLRGDIEQQETLLFERAAIACEVTTGSPLSVEEFVRGVCEPGAQPPIVEGKNVLLAVFTSMFLHGGLGHVLFNMWFLWIFGNNVEEAFGHAGYLASYLVGGIAATLTFVFMNPDSVVPLVGASGAIAFTLGSYAVLFPGHRVQSLVGYLVLPVPAVLFLAIWFFLQFTLFGTNTAWEAHVGGFIFGLLLTLPLRGRLLSRV